MPEFLSQPDFHRRGKLLVLDAPLRFRDAAGRIWEVPAGFPSDLASVPLLLPGVLHALLGSLIESAGAALVHDYLYASGLVPRREADRIFYQALRAEGAGRARATCYWLGVRAGGWLAWRSHRKGA